MNTRSTVAPLQQAVATAQKVQTSSPAATPSAVPAQASAHRVAYSLPEGSACPQCQQVWPAGSSWCPQCGAGVPCPHCGTACGGGDFCEACGNWLLEGQCKLCYAPLQEGAQFCVECGCNHQGTWCQHCGITCHFDFCTQCGDALSERAQALVAAAQQEALEQEQELLATPQLQALQEQLQALEAEMGPLAQAAYEVGSSHTDSHGLGFWDDDDDFTPLTPSGGGSSGSGGAGASQPRKSLLGSSALAKLQEAREAQQETYRKALEAKEAAYRKAQEEARKAQEQARLQRVQLLLAQSRVQRFASGQEARLFEMAVRKKLEQNGVRIKGWLCNYACNVHDQPSKCARPEEGGQWVVE